MIARGSPRIRERCRSGNGLAVASIQRCNRLVDLGRACGPSHAGSSDLPRTSFGSARPSPRLRGSAGASTSRKSSHSRFLETAREPAESTIGSFPEAEGRCGRPKATDLRLGDAGELLQELGAPRCDRRATSQPSALRNQRALSVLGGRLLTRPGDCQACGPDCWRRGFHYCGYGTPACHDGQRFESCS